MYKCYPVDYISITTGYSSSHQAIDCGWWGDTSDRPIYSVSDGKVLELRNDYATQDTSGNSYGNYVTIQNSDGSTSTYCHLKYQSVIVKVGDKVKQHQQIATMGTTGHSTGPHLHYEHRINGSKVNPFDYLYKFEYQEINYNKPDSKYIKTKPAYKYKVGDMVILNGYYHKTCETGSECLGEVYNYVGKIVEIKDGEYPYHIENMGWCREKYLSPYSGTDYKYLYEQELLKNKDLEKQVANLQSKIDKAIKDLK